MSSPVRLPRGRHTLSRAQVTASQRDRLLRAMADVMADKGYVGTSVADVLRAAGVSRQTFYEQFTSKEDCFMSAFDEAARIVVEMIGEATGGALQETGGDPVERFRRLLGAYLEALRSEPGFARLFLVEVYAAGPGAIARRTASQKLFAALLADGLGTDDFTSEAIVAAVASMVTARIAAGEVDALPELRDPIVGLVRRLVAPAADPPPPRTS